MFHFFVVVVFQIELMADFMLYSKFVIVFLVPLLITLHLFGDMLLSDPVTTTLTYFVIAVVTTNLM